MYISIYKFCIMFLEVSSRALYSNKQRQEDLRPSRDLIQSQTLTTHAGASDISAASIEVSHRLLMTGASLQRPWPTPF